MKDGDVMLIHDRTRHFGEAMKETDAQLMRFIMDRVPPFSTVELWANAVDVTIPYDADPNALWADGRYAAHDLNQDHWDGQDWAAWSTLSGGRQLQVKTAEVAE